MCFCELFFLPFIPFPVGVLVFFLLSYKDSAYSKNISPLWRPIVFTSVAKCFNNGSFVEVKVEGLIG